MGLAKVTTEKLPLEGALLVRGFQFGDGRGSFVKLAEGGTLGALGFAAVEIFYSVNRKNALRGLHYVLPGPQARLVFCTAGKAYDVMVDLRKGSRTFGKWHAVELSGGRPEAVFIPKGFAHGFLALEDGTTIAYLADSDYSPERDKGINYADSDLAISWPLSGEPVMSDRDRAFPLLRDAETY